jgi:AhpD family alkylhydroperoxidase
VPARIEYEKAAPGSTDGLTELARFVRAGSLPPALIELVFLRASQINGCAFCLDLHYRRARRAGVPQAQLDTLPAWPESPAFSEKERAALTWTESLTRVSRHHVPDPVWDTVRAHWTEREIVELSIAIVEINAWNRLMIAFRTPLTFGTSSKPAGDPAGAPPAGPGPASGERPSPSP